VFDPLILKIVKKCLSFKKKRSKSKPLSFLVIFYNNKKLRTAKISY